MILRFRRRACWVLLLLSSGLLIPASVTSAGPTNQIYCGSEDENPWSNGTPCLVSTTPIAGGVEYFISAPVVDRATFVYSPINFQPGDKVTVKAGGCVQTGGSGATWKRYVNPSGSESGAEDPGLYHGTITIPGGFASGSVLAVNGWSIQRTIKATEAAPVVVAAPQSGGPPPSDTLILGYRDDNYGDNGYYAHDNGNYAQCAYSNDGNDAYVVVDVVHGPPAPPPSRPPEKSFDVAPSGYDTNWFPADPVWGWQIPGVSHAAKKGYYTSECKVPLLYPAPDTCTSQATQFNPAPDPGFFSNPWRSVKDFFGLCKYSSDIPIRAGMSFPFLGGRGGHLNWGPVTYRDGLIYWDELAGTLTGDDDYNMWLQTPEIDGYYSGVTPPAPVTAKTSPMALEYDSDETIDNFDEVPWWHEFHEGVDESGTLAGDWMARHINGHEAVVGGILGLDDVHGPSGGSEIHPVQLLAIRGATPNAVDPSDDQWDFFIRNWGDEGECSSDQEYLGAESLTLRLPPPSTLASSGGLFPQGLTASIVSEDVRGFDLPANPALWVDNTGAYITVHLPSASDGGMLFGDVQLQWSVVTPAADVTTSASAGGLSGAGASGIRRTAAAALPPISALTPDDGEPEGELKTAGAHLDAKQRKEYEKMIYPYRATLPTGKPKAAKLVAATEAPKLAAVPPRVRQVYDPVHVRNIVSRWYALCVVTKGKPVGLAGCPSESELKKLPPPRVLVAPGAPPSYQLAGKSLPVDRQTGGHTFWHYVLVVIIALVALGFGIYFLILIYLGLLLLVTRLLRWRRRHRY